MRMITGFKTEANLSTNVAGTAIWQNEMTCLLCICLDSSGPKPGGELDMSTFLATLHVFSNMNMLRMD